MAQKFTITAELNLQTKNLTQVVNNLRQQFQGANLNIKLKDLAAAQSHIQNISKSTQGATKSFNSLGSSVVAAAKRFSGMALATGTLVGLTRAIKNAVGEAIEFEREIVKISQATGKTVGDLKSLSNEIGNVASQFGVSSKELILATRELTQAGFAADKVRGTLKLLAQTELAATFDSIADTTEGVIAILNQFGREAQRTGTEIDFLEKSLSAINQVSKDFAVESSDLITAIRTTGSAFQSAGGSLDELLALFTSVRATTRESAESIATGFRTIFTRIQRVDTINALRNLGVELQDAEGKFVGPMEAAKKLAIALQTIDPRDFRFNLVVEELGGFRQVSKVIPLIQQFAIAQKALNVAQGSSGSLAKDAKTAQQSLGVQIEKTREEFKRFIRDLTESGSFQDTVRFLLNMANAFIKVADTIKPLIPLIASFGALQLGRAFVPAIGKLANIGKKAQGGPIGFASGGMVPGQGNGDTVPAMLTPGEFVIRKSSVNKLGADNLARMNKYGKGGSVQYYADPAGSVKENDKTKQYRESGETHFTHLDKLSPHKGQKIYSNLGIDLPATWNLDWNDNPNKIGPTPKRFAKYIMTHDIFKTLLGKTRRYGFRNPAAKEALDKHKNIIKADFARRVGSIPIDIFDTDSNVISKGVGDKLIQSIPMEDRALIEGNLKDIVARKVTRTSSRTGKEYESRERLKESLPGYDWRSKKGSAEIFQRQGKALGGLIQAFETGGFVKLHSSKARTSKSKLDKFNIKYPDGKTGDPNHEINFTEGVWDASFDVSDPRALDYFVRSIHESQSQKAAMKAYAQSKGKSESQIYNLLQGQNADWFEDRIHDEIGGTLAGGNYYVDILNAQRHIKGDVDVKDTKVREPISEFVQKAYKHAAWEYVSGLSKQDPRTASNLGISSVTTHTKDPVFAKSLKQAIADMTSKTASKQTVALLEKLGLTRPTFADVDKTVNAATFKPRATEYNGKQLSNLATYDSAKKVYDELNRKYRKEGDIPKLETAFSAILGAQIKADSNLTDQQVASIKANFLKKYGYAKGGSIASLTDIPWMAQGGAAGTDTVPAMLTPGEFVINKKSAQAIGHSALNRMNKVGKFAKGGVVGGIQHFAGGAEVQAFAANAKTQYGTSSQNLKAIELFIKQLEVLEKKGENVTAAIKSLEKNLSYFGSQAHIVANDIALDAKKASKRPTTQGIINTVRGDQPSAPKLSDKLKEVADAGENSANKFLILAGITESVVTQFANLSDEQKAYYSALGASFAIYKGIGSSLKDFGLDIAIAAIKRKEEKVALQQSSIAMKNHAQAANQAATQLKGSSVAGGATGGGKGLAGGMKKMETGLAIVDGAITGFSTAMAIAAANAAYYAEVAEKSAKKMDETIDLLSKDASRVSLGRLTSDISQTSSDKAKAGLMSKIGSESSSMLKIAAASLTGATVGGLSGAAAGSATGTPIGTAVGATVGATAGGVAGGVAEYERQKMVAEAKQKQMLDDLNKASASLAMSFKTSAEETQKLQKFMGDIDKKSDKEVSAQANTSLVKYTQSLNEATNAELKYMNAAGSLVEAQKLFGDEIKKAKEKADEFGKALDQIIGAEYARQINQLGQKVGTKGVDIQGEIKKIVGSQKENIATRQATELKSQYGAKIEDLNRGAKQTGEKALFAKFAGGQIQKKMFGAGGLSDQKAAKQELELGKAATEAAIQLIKQKQAIEEERAIREKLIGSLATQLALSAGLENFEYSIKKANDSIDNAGAVFSNSMSQFKSNIPSADVLSLSMPNESNMGDFTKAMEVISSIGPTGKKLADNFSQLNSVMPKLEVGLAKGNIGVGAKSEDIKGFVTSLGLDAGSEVGQAITKAIEQETKSSEITKREGIASPEETAKKIKDNVEKYAKVLQEGGGRILKAMQEHEASIAKAYDQIGESRKRSLDIELEGADGYQELVKNVANAQGRILTLNQKNELRTRRQNMLAGKLAGSPVAIGKRLEEIRKNLASETDMGKKAGLNQEATRLKQALKELSNQSSRTADTLSELEKLKQQRETAKDFTKSYLFGTQDEQQKTDETLMALQGAMQTGDISSIPDELKSGVSSILDQFKDIPAFNGMTGKQVQNQLMANKMAQMGNYEGAQTVLNETSSPEQQLIKELGSIYAQEEESRKTMLQEELAYQAALNASIEANTKSLDNLAKDVEQKKTELTPVGGKDNVESPEKLEAQKKALEASLTQTNEKIAKLDESINSTLDQIDNLFKQVKERIEGTAQTKAMGGLIYRAGGGFAPKGTDTVPAMLTPGEFVVKKSAVDKVGVGALNQINAGHYAVGGQVDPNDPYYKMLGDARRSKDKRKEELRALEGESPITRTMQNRAERGPGPMAMRAAMFNQNMRQNIISANQMRSQPMNLTMMRQQAMSRGGGAVVTAANQTSPAAPAVAAAAPGAGGGAAAPDMAGFAQSVESLNSIASTFSTFTETLSNLANQFAGITVQHTLTVDGSLAITGVNGDAIAAQLSNAIKEQIKNMVEEKLGGNNRQEKR